MKPQAMTESERKDYNLAQLSNIRNLLQMETAAQQAWVKLRPAEREFFIKSAKVSVDKNDWKFDEFSSTVQHKLYQAVCRAQHLAGRFKATMRPMEAAQSQLRAG